MNENQIMNIQGIPCYEKDGTAYLQLDASVFGLGITQKKNGIEYIRWDRVEQYLKDLGFPHKWGKGDFIPENIFYRLAMKAKNAVAEAFQAKVADEIIPSIRKYGAYIAGQESMTREQLISKALIAANEIMDEQNRKIAMLESKVETDAPKVDFYDAIEASVNSISVGEMAKLLQNNNIDTGRNRLMKTMLERGYMMRDGRNTVPTQKALNLGILEAKETYYTCNGSQCTRITSVFTGKGQTYMIKKWFDIFE